MMNNSEEVVRIRRSVWSSVDNSRRDTKDSFTTARRQDLSNLAIKSKIPSLGIFQSICARFAKDKRADDLRIINHSLASGLRYGEMFMNTRGALSVLVGFITGTNTKLQLEATQCVINLGCAPIPECLIICQKVGAYLVTNMHSDNAVYQNLSAWAMGNICCQSEYISEIARCQGLEVALLNLLSAEDRDVHRSACYALHNYMRSQPHRITNLFQPKAVAILVKQFNRQGEYMAEMAWCLFVFSTISECCQILISEGVVQAVLACLYYLRTENIMDISLCTACVRILTNCIAETAQVSFQIISNMNNFLQICEYLADLPSHHLRKELLQCIANLYNVLQTNNDGLNALADCHFEQLMEPVVINLQGLSAFGDCHFEQQTEPVVIYMQGIDMPTNM